MPPIWVGFWVQTSLKQESLLPQNFLKHGWVFQKLAKFVKNGQFSAEIHHKSGYDGNYRKLEEGSFLKTEREIHPEVMYPPPGNFPGFISLFIPINMEAILQKFPI